MLKESHQSASSLDLPQDILEFKIECGSSSKGEKECRFGEDGIMWMTEGFVSRAGEAE